MIIAQHLCFTYYNRPLIILSVVLLSQIAATKAKLGELHRIQGHYEDAKVLLEEAMETYKLVFSKEHPAFIGEFLCCFVFVCGSVACAWFGVMYCVISQLCGHTDTSWNLLSFLFSAFLCFVNTFLQPPNNSMH